MKKGIVNDYATYKIDNGILFFTYKENIILRLAEAIEIVTERIAFQNGKAYPILCDIRGIKHIDKDARRYLSTEGAQLTKAVAFISDNPLSHILSNVYLKANTPPNPIKVVGTELEGIKFLSDYVD